MRILLDTHLWLWWLHEDTGLSKDARRAIESPENEVFVSVISLWEAMVKVGTGKLKVDGDLEATSINADLQFLPFVPRHAVAVGRLPSIHRDPFDRALVAQAMSEGMRLLTADQEIARYAAVADISLM